MIRSYLKFAPRDESLHVNFTVFTDRHLDAQKIANMLSDERKVSISVREIPPLRWPQATMARYRLMSDELSSPPPGRSYWIDADMKFTQHFFLSQSGLHATKGMVFVHHPGYWRPKSKASLFATYFKSPSVLVTDFRSLSLLGGIGAWETRKACAAFVSRRDRKHYVAGGFWGGDNKSVIEALQSILEAERKDERASLIPVWHDESYLNAWYAVNRKNVALLSPEYCWSDTAPFLEGQSAKIIAVTKRLSTRD